jgi:hypothetical protein
MALMITVYFPALKKDIEFRKLLILDLHASKRRLASFSPTDKTNQDKFSTKVRQYENKLYEVSARIESKIEAIEKLKFDAK